jgi:hypothetical protein
MAREITTTGSKKVATLMKEFNSNYPYLRLKICPFTEKAKVAKGDTIYGVDGNVEREFETIFGLYVQICYTDKNGNRFYTSGSDDKKSLSALNREKAAAGCKKGEWK